MTGCLRCSSTCASPGADDDATPVPPRSRRSRPRSGKRSGARPSQRHRAAGAGDGRGAHGRGRRGADGWSRRHPVPDPRLSPPLGAGSWPSSGPPPMSAIPSVAESPDLAAPVLEPSCAVRRSLDGARAGRVEPPRTSTGRGAAGDPQPCWTGPAAGAVTPDRRVRRRPRSSRRWRTASTTVWPAAGRRRGAAARADPAEGRTWAMRRDRIRTADAVGGAGRPRRDGATSPVYLDPAALSAIDRLEVRGRDSAGCTCWCWDHGLDLDDPAPPPSRARRDPLFGPTRCARRRPARSSTRRRPRSVSSATTPGALRAAILADDLLPLALCPSASRSTVLGHTRWASVGIISEPNAHPVNSEEDGAPGRSVRRRRPERRRRQPRRPEGRRRAGASRPNHHRRQGDPDARLAAGWPSQGPDVTRWWAGGPSPSSRAPSPSAPAPRRPTA